MDITQQLNLESMSEQINIHKKQQNKYTYLKSLCSKQILLMFWGTPPKNRVFLRDAENVTNPQRSRDDFLLFIFLHPFATFLYILIFF